MPTASPAPAANCPPIYEPGATTARTPWTTGQGGTQLRSLWKRAGWILAVCILMALLYAPPPWRNLRGYAESLLYSFSYFFGLWLANGYVVDWLNKQMGWERPLRRLLLTVSVSLVASLVVLVVVPVFYSVVLYHQQPGQVLHQPKFWAQASFPLLITAIISLFMHSRSFMLAWREATVRAERLEKESAVARLDSLRRQVDPHFLFNSLNALTSLVEEEPQRAVRFIRQLSSVYRYVLDSQSQELVPLADELAFAEAYVYLQQTRLGEALHVELPALSAEAASLYLPPLALQLLLENALKHNAAYQAEPLRLRVHLDTTQQQLTVVNTLRPRRLAPGEVSGRGLANLRARYAFLTPRPLAAGPVGEEFVVTLPLLAL